MDESIAEQLHFAHYGDLFLPSGVRAGIDPLLDASDIEPGFETELLALWYRDAQLHDPNVPNLNDSTRLPHMPHMVQRMLNALSQSRTFAGFAEHALIFQLKQVRRYIEDTQLRSKIQERITKGMTSETNIVIAHSLGTVAAYEALCSASSSNVRGFITLGSPLGIPHLIFDRLIPNPVNGVGVWPGSLDWWVNVADSGDAVAIEKHLVNRFGPRVEDCEVNNGRTEVHAVDLYLSQSIVGTAAARLVQGPRA